jgi:hypothetical protein
VKRAVHVSTRSSGRSALFGGHVRIHHHQLCTSFAFFKPTPIMVGTGKEVRTWGQSRVRGAIAAGETE